ncbi:bifunctional hydroxymethylpyrimidine kinase/phosphomethylpyrimidine kinase [Corynebacterium alimapuense]|uniref:Thiamine biosynthesis multifunctional protein ThiED n=1 Tax=Corynebacterium alimapuense TaxID=1576874 RepID=A0A3M8K9A3_9CORY|nr:bifunctional hydroxymethylpyrimidine kinase/phosphomethylpyrimidine kinase [Corynebacterium alimapuense]RNE49122.1 bifunctional hydroxymethylpyrimidine kinase/phosphomethylpyrimidine kinase [Corynebacterium alimapuense]
MIPRVLSIAGTDPSGGAGIQADLKSISAAGGYGMCAITAVVSQNTLGVRSVFVPPREVLAEQLTAVFEDVSVDAVKIGMLGDLQTIEVVAQFLASYTPRSVVLDPVMVASSGDRLLDREAETAMRDLVPLVDVVTPNLWELAVLVGRDRALDQESALAQAKALAAESGTVVIVKGGHFSGPAADNAVVDPNGRVHLVPSPRVETVNTHGTGCSLSSALATCLGAGDSVEQALEWSTRWLYESIVHADELAVGSGNGPIDHGHRARRLAAAASTRPWGHLTTGKVSDVQAPTPVLAPAGPHTRLLWEATGGVWASIMGLPFIRGLGSGTLPETDFGFYLEQDARYLNRYARALALLAARAPDTESQVGWANGASGCITTEAALHREWLGDREVSSSGASPVTMAYTDFLVASAAVEDYVVAAAAVLPCYWLYAEIGMALLADDYPDHPYHQWLGTYSGSEFLDAAQAAIERVEKALEQASPPQRQAAMESYLTACIHEQEFFDQADRAW